MNSPVTIVGAGPNGLSIAAHLNSRGVRPAIFGRPMEFWRAGMSPRMRLKSDGFASNLSEPSGKFTLEAFCRSQGLPYENTLSPVPRSTFVKYGEAFQKRFVRQLDTRHVRAIVPTFAGFRLELEDGDIFESERVVVATGISSFARIPKPLRDISPPRIFHSGAVPDYAAFEGRRVLVVGAGASATDCAAELVRAGADVTLTCRRKKLVFSGRGEAPTALGKLRHPPTPVGPGWRRLLMTRFPQMFRLAPEWVRVWAVDNSLGPAPAWFVKEEIDGKIHVLPDREILRVDEDENGLEFQFARIGAQLERRTFDYVIAGTGYVVDVSRLEFLDPQILAALALVDGAPRLSSEFESSIPGLYFVGAPAAYTFGPLMRFVCGAQFAAPRVAAAIAASVEARPEAGFARATSIRLLGS